MKRFYDSIVDEAGNIVVGAEVYVRDNTSGDLVTIYSDNGSTATANPTLSGNDGYVSFWTADATLKLEIVIDGELEKTIPDHQHFDNLDNEIKALRSVTSAANKGFMFTGSGTGATYDLTAFALTILDDADAATVRTTLGVGTGDSPQFTAINLGHASDTTITRTGAGDIAIEGNAIYRAGGTDVPLADGGTGASSASGARTNLGLGTLATVSNGAISSFTAAGALIYLNATQAGSTTGAETVFDASEHNDSIQPVDAGGTQRFWLGINKSMTVADAAADTLTITGHGLTTGEGPFLFINSGGALPGGLSTATKYWAIVSDANTIKVATSRANALAGTAVDVTSSGTGTHTLNTGPYLVIPKGPTRVELQSSAEDTGDLAGQLLLRIWKNGAFTAYAGQARTDAESTAASEGGSVSVGPITVAEGDMFSQGNQGADAYTLATLVTWLSLKVVK